MRSAALPEMDFSTVGGPELLALVKSGSPAEKRDAHIERRIRDREFNDPPYPDPALFLSEPNLMFPTRYVGLLKYERSEKLLRKLESLRKLPYFSARSHYCAIHIELNQRAAKASLPQLIAPNYRPIRRVRPKGRRSGITVEDALLSNDSQVIDFHWCWATAKGRLTPSGRPFSDWLFAHEFPFDSVSEFISRPLRPATKLKDLGIPHSLQWDLAILKAPDVRKRYRYLQDRRTACLTWLRRKAKDNRYIAGHE